MAAAPHQTSLLKRRRSVSVPDRASRAAVRSLERAGVVPRHVVQLTVGGSEPRKPVRAAQYVRMSTEHQNYSIGYQCEAIRVYAKERGMRVVRTYADEAKSGVTIEHRSALRALLADVVGGRADFETILVYDVSRWGRFQDTDESAYYEYLCRREGIHVEYCAEPFRNDGTAVSSLIKNIKRMMAGEYSRELSQKMFAAKCQAVRMGFSAGSGAGYGYRRKLLDPSGRERGTLEAGERKTVASDRIVLVPGPQEEVEAVRWIFEQVAKHATRPGVLAAELNRRGVPWVGGKPWHSQRVQYVLSNEKYIGNTVYNRCSAKLRTPRVRNPPAEWVRVEGSHEGIVPPALFWKAQDRMDTWSTRITNETALVKLRELLDRQGSLSAKLIDGTEGMPGSAFYRNRFGGLTRAYELVGYKPIRDYGFLPGYAWRERQLNGLRERVADELRSRGVVVERETLVIMRLGAAVRLAVLQAHFRPIKGAARWFVQIHTKPPPDWLLVGRLNEAKSAVRDYCLMRGGITNIWLGARHRDGRFEERYDEGIAPLLDRLASIALAQEAVNPPSRAGRRK